MTVTTLQRPLSVVGTDQEALKALLRIHAVPEPRILDVTYNRGRIWKGLDYRPHRLDRDPDLHAAGWTDTVADFRALPFEPESWDVLVFDPPHLTDNAGAFKTWRKRRGTKHVWCEAFGTGAADLVGDDISPLFRPFLTEARRVLVPETGIVLSKICDIVHRGAYRWQHLDLVLAARELGFTPCDLMIHVALSRGQMIHPAWRRVCHVRSVHTYWLVLRNGPDCISANAPHALRYDSGPLFVEVVS